MNKYFKFIKRSFLCILSLFFSISIAQNVKAQDAIKLQILRNLFNKHQLNTYNNKEVFSTIARNKFASIPLTDEESKLLELYDGIFAFLFTIYLSDNEEDYETLENSNFDLMDVIVNQDPVYELHKNERLIQLILYDIKQDKFIAKPDHFPIEELQWFSAAYGDTYYYISIISFDAINNDDKTFYLKLNGCGECESSFYFFHFDNDIIAVSDEIKGCLKNIRVVGNEIAVTKIINCYDAELNGEEAVTKELTVLRW